MKSWLELSTRLQQQTLIIHCPSVKIEERLKDQRSEIVAIANYADRITLVQFDKETFVLKD